MAEKEAIQALQEEEQSEQKRKAKAEKRTQKKVQKGGRFGEKRKVEHALDQDEWTDHAGKLDT